ncbi:MAG: hypothetical protein A3C47_02725 [Omnitrophica bacterium RIFCSPHIGHO2_02_FULL_51_18]|nr:MAG: hypothetical protein A3C47_02725 [Omnitrophica bacterium RIFCSPHIGHO2_02_FULL_51_18]
MKILRSENLTEQIIGLTLIVAGVASRLLPHAENFTPVMAVAFFGGVVLSPGIALTIPLIVMIVSDILIGPHDLFFVTWGSFFIISLFGFMVGKNPKWNRVLLGTLGGSLFYFFTTNLAVFVFQSMYPKTWSGLVECFMMAIPFFRNSLLSDLAYTALLFGLFFMAKSFSTRFISPQKTV